MREEIGIMRKSNKQVISMFFLGFVLLLTGHWARAAGLEAEMVIFNGKILTADSPDPNDFSIAQAAAIYDGKFVAVGNNDEVLEYAGPSTRKIDLGGRTVVPGLIDTHYHIYAYGEHFFPEGTRIDHSGRTTDPRITWTNKADFLAQIRTLALSKKPGEWIITSPRGGYTSSQNEPGSGPSAVVGGDIVVELQNGAVTRFDLDQVAPNNPMFLEWTQEGLVNTKALDLLLERYPSVAGVRRDGQGVPTGRLKGLAIEALQYDFYPQVPPEEIAPYHEMEMEESAAQGVTTVSTRLNPRHLAAYSWLNIRGRMPIRMAYTSEIVSLNPNVEATFSRLVGLQGGKGDNMWGAGDETLWLVGMAAGWAIDGAPASAGACVSKPYPRESFNFPVWRFQFQGPNGICTLEDPNYNFQEAFRAAAKYGFRTTAMHTAGDRAVDLYLDMVEELSKEYPDIVERRWGIDHCRYITREHARRAKKLGIIFACGPKYVYAGQRGDVGAYSELFGEAEAGDAVVPLRTLLDNGLRTTIHQDQHGFHPFLSLEVAVTRKDVIGKVWGPQQRVSRREALYMLTRWSSEYVLREKLMGSIEPKKYADFAVLSQDYLTVPEDEIAMTDSLLTVMGGKITYTQPEFASAQGLPQVGFRENPTWWKRGTPEEARRARASQ